MSDMGIRIVRSFNVKKSMHYKLLLLTTLAVVNSFAIEQAVAQTAPAGPSTAVPVPSNVVKQSRPYYVEGAVVVGLMAAAVFAVCRSSRRV